MADNQETPENKQPETAERTASDVTPEERDEQAVEKPAESETEQLPSEEEQTDGEPEAADPSVQETAEQPTEAGEYEEIPAEEAQPPSRIFALRTTANREDQVLSFVSSNAARKKIPVYAVIAPHGMRGYIFLEAQDAIAAEQAASGVPYAKGVIPKEIDYKEIEHMLEQVKKEITIQKNDIVEIIAGPFKREQAKITRVDKQKEEAVVELLEAAVPIPITLKLDDVKVIRREE